MTRIRFRLRLLLALFGHFAISANPAIGQVQRPPANASTTGLTRLAQAVIQKVEATPEYLAMKTHFENRRQRDGAAWVRSAAGQKIAATLKRLRADAASATIFDPEDTRGGGNVNFTRWDGKVTRLSSIVAFDIETNASRRDNAADIVCRYIIMYALEEGLIPAEFSPGYNAAMAQGYAAAQQEDYRAAIAQFGKARYIAPKAAAIYYNLGLAEARIVGREQRAVAWFGAFLAADPKTPKASAVLAEMKSLNARSLSRFLTLTEEVARQNPDYINKDISLMQTVELWAKAGDRTAAFKAIDGIRGLDVIGRSQLSIVDAQLAEGDITGALQTIARIQHLYSKSSALQRTADAQTKNGDKTAALQTLAAALAISDRIEDESNRSMAKSAVAFSQTQAGDLAAAFRSVDGIIDPFSSSLANSTLAEVQAQAGDLEGSRRTLAVVLQNIERIDYPFAKKLAVTGYDEVKARIANGTAGSPWAAAAAANPPAATLRDWTGMNVGQGILDAPVFLDLKSYLGTVPTSEPKKAFDAMHSTASRMIAAQETTKLMLKQLGFALP